MTLHLTLSKVEDLIDDLLLSALADASHMQLRNDGKKNTPTGRRMINTCAIIIKFLRVLGTFRPSAFAKSRQKQLSECMKHQKKQQMRENFNALAIMISCVLDVDEVSLRNSEHENMSAGGFVPV